MRFWILLCLISLLVISCDINGQINIRNKTDQTLKFRHYIVINNIPKDTLKLDINAKSARLIPFGLGNFWTNERLSEFVKNTSKIELIQGLNTLRIYKQVEILKFYEDKIKGFKNYKLEIVVD